MGKQTGLIRRGGRYSLRIVVPKDVLATFTPIWDRERGAGTRRRNGEVLSQVWIPLNETDSRKVVAEANLERVFVDGLFHEARAGSAGAFGPAVAPVSPDRGAIHRAVRNYFYNLESKSPAVPMDLYDREDALKHAIDEAVGIHGTPVESSLVQLVANEVAADAHLAVTTQSSMFAELMEAVKTALDEHHTRVVERLSLEPIRRGHPLFVDIGPNNPPPKLMTLQEAVATYKSAPERADRAAKTKKAWDFRFAVWCDLLGPQKLISTITRAEVKQARDTLMAVPPNAVKLWPGKPFSEIAEIARAKAIPPMHTKSVQLYMESLASLMKWLVAEGEIATNPAVGIGAAAAPADHRRARRTLTLAELRHLFKSGPYAAPATTRGWKFWLPLIGLFEGMRLAEILGLRAADVTERDGVPVLNISSYPGRALKTVQSARVVPVHPALQDLGFLAFAAKQPAGGPLFRDLPGGKTDPLNASQKSMGRLIRDIFPDDPDLVFHSLRHTWTDAARNVYVKPDILERLGGWKAPGSSAMHGYGDGYRPSTLAPELSKIVFPGLDLSHLHPTAPRV